MNYGTDTTPQGRMVIRNLLKATQAGLGDGGMPIFPVHIFKVKEGINLNPGEPNYDLFQMAIQVACQRVSLHFSFLDAPFNLRWYRPDDYRTETAYQGNNIRVMENVAEPSCITSCGRGNLSFTSINLPRIALESNGSFEKFCAILEKRLELTARQLRQRMEIQGRRRAYNYPFLMGQGVWIHSDSLYRDDEVEKVLQQGTLSIGFVGLAEALQVLTGHHHGQSEDSQRLGLEIIGRMAKFTEKKCRETKLNWNLIATPNKGTAMRFARLDRKKFGEIPGITDKEKYTESFLIPEDGSVNVYQRIYLEAPYHALTLGGHLCRAELDSNEPERSWKKYFTP